MEIEDRFGSSVDIHGNTAVIGAYLNNNRGSAYVYTRFADNWSLKAKLVPIDGEEDDGFGDSVAIHGNTIIVGAEKGNYRDIDSGSAYLYNRIGNSWFLLSKLVPENSQEGDTFGVSVAIDGDSVIVGASGDNDKGIDSGFAYVYQLET